MMAPGGQSSRTFYMSLELACSGDEFRRNVGFGGACLSLRLHSDKTELCSFLVIYYESV